MSLQRSADAFKSSMSSAADLFPARPKPIVKPAAAPVVSPSTNVKRKRIITTQTTTPASTVYNQPATTALQGQHIMTQVLHAQQYLKEKERPLRPADVASYLSLPVTSVVFTVLKENKNPRIRYDAENDTLEFRPLHNIRSATDLLAFLQRQTTAQGLPVKDLKDGWAGAIDAIDTLESAGDILVVRTKKENQPRMVWCNDKTLFCDIDDEFRGLWHTVKIPVEAEMVFELQKLGLKPASVDPATIKVDVKRPVKRKRAVNRRGKVSNVHMSGILKDSKDLRK